MSKVNASSTAGEVIYAGPFGFLNSFSRIVSWRLALARTRRQLMALDDRMLQDIGLARTDIKGNFWEVSRRNRAAP
jgi:uncharacterized protein YjiS (DUF1127 family)